LAPGRPAEVGQEKGVGGLDAYIGVGHGRTPEGNFDPGAVSGGLVEHDVAISVVDAYADAMRRSGLKVADESHSGVGHDPNFIGSASRANDLGVKYADEVHFNAGGGTGVEVLVDGNTSAANKQACRAIAAGIAEVLDLPVRRDRGLFVTSGFGFLTRTNMPSAIIEVAFLDTATDRRAIRKKDALENVGEAIAQARLDFLGVGGGGPVGRVPKESTTLGIPIGAGKPSAAKRRAHAWADSKGCAEVFHEVIDAGWKNAGDIGIDAAVFVAQAAKETGFGKFGGVIDASFHNSGGLKTTAGGDNDAPEAHQRFRNWETGTRAHCAHLALYAGVISVAEAKKLGDKRAFDSIAGVAPTVQELGGKWAPATDYGRSIVRDLLRPLRRF
jgi:N-acetylmuramoyl-L-alanine amidase/Mannosyl-glycoprotein endo-beta-N-acetylglucosaminidase